MRIWAPRVSFRDKALVKIANAGFDAVDFDFITEVPMTRKSIKKRGYNQCCYLAKGISENIGYAKPDATQEEIDASEAAEGEEKKPNTEAMAEAKAAAEAMEKSLRLGRKLFLFTGTR